MVDDDVDEQDNVHVACVSCGKPIERSARQCHFCGVKFAGEAWEFVGAEYGVKRVRRPMSITWLLILFGFVNIGFLIYALLYLRAD